MLVTEELPIDGKFLVESIKVHAALTRTCR